MEIIIRFIHEVPSHNKLLLEMEARTLQHICIHGIYHMAYTTWHMDTHQSMLI